MLSRVVRGLLLLQLMVSTPPPRQAPVAVLVDAMQCVTQSQIHPFSILNGRGLICK